jgi:hypothetical protein
MWTPPTVTIAFRGLLCFSEVVSRHRRYFEIGVVASEHHILRINTIKNCVLSSVHVLKNHINHNHPYWFLTVEKPIFPGVRRYEVGTFVRTTHSVEQDYRWINVFNEHFTCVEDKVDLGRLSPVLRIPHGTFYTLLKSPFLSKSVDGTSSEFGSIAAVTGLDIPIFEGSVKLISETSGNTIFEFTPEPNTIYEFANTPPDVEIQHCPCCPCSPYTCDNEHDSKCHCQCNCHKQGGNHSVAAPNDPEAIMRDVCDKDHFKNYYQLFKDPSAEPRVCFFEPGPPPAPNPTLCGAIELRISRSAT